jgi:hypothetical protein
MTTSFARFFFLLSIAAVVLLQFPSAGQAQQPPPPEQEQTFGIVGGYWRPTAATELGVRWDRITFDWSRFQPNGPGDFVREAVRPAWIERSIADGRQVVGMIVNTPPWASDVRTPAGVPASLYRAADDPENLWALFLRQLVQEYAPLGVHHWIIWDNINAPAESPDFRLGGDIDTYVQMVRIAHEVFRAEDETAQLYLGGLVGLPAPDDAIPYLQTFIDEINDDPLAPANNFYFDGVTLNFLLEPSTSRTDIPMTDTIIPALAQTREILETTGLNDKTVWVTELNASPTLDPLAGLAEIPSTGITVEQQADFIVQGSALTLTTGADRTAVYQLFDTDAQPSEAPFSLIRFDNSVRPGFTAYQHAIQLFEGAENTGYDQSTNGRLVTLTQPEQTVFVMWSARTTPVSFWIEARFGDELQVFDSLGNVFPEPRQGVGPDDTTVHVIDTPAAQATASDIVLVSGSPRIVVLNTTEPRRVWASLGDAIGVQLR